MSMSTAAATAATTGGTLILRHGRRHLSHLHRGSPSSSQPVSPVDGRLLHWRSTDFDDHNFQIHGHTLLYLFILFALILLAALILLYARWFLRVRRLSAASVAAAHPPLPHHPQPKGLDFAAINNLPITLHQSSDLTDGTIHDFECCICLGSFEDGDKVKVLPGCDHRYHSHCVDAWLSGHSNCPLCRLPIRVDPLPV